MEDLYSATLLFVSIWPTAPSPVPFMHRHMAWTALITEPHSVDSVFAPYMDATLTFLFVMVSKGTGSERE